MGDEHAEGMDMTSFPQPFKGMVEIEFPPIFVELTEQKETSDED